MPLNVIFEDISAYESDIITIINSSVCLRYISRHKTIQRRITLKFHNRDVAVKCIDQYKLFNIYN